MSQSVKQVLVCDIGGSHISVAVCFEHTYSLLGTARAALPTEARTAASVRDPSQRFVRLIYSLAKRATAAADVKLANVGGIDLAFPGPFDYAKGISHIRHKLQSLFGVDLKSALAARFGWQPSQIRFVNDAAAFLLGEVGAGAARGLPRSVGITLGTGIGCAFALGDETGGHIAIPSDQPNGDPTVPPGGEIWNLPYNGATVEDFISTRFLRRRFLALAGLEAEVIQVAAIARCGEGQACPELETILANQTNQPVPDETIRSAADSADPSESATQIGLAGPLQGNPAKAAREAFEEFGMHLGLALSQHAAAFRPDVVVLGGGIARASQLFLPATRKALSFTTRMEISTLMDQAPLAGAGVHWFSA